MVLILDLQGERKFHRGGQNTIHMAHYALDVSFFRKWSSEWTAQKEEMLRTHPQMVLHQQAILTALDDAEDKTEHASAQLDDGASLDTSPGLFPLPYFSDQETSEEGGERPLSRPQSMEDEAVEDAEKPSDWGEDLVHNLGGTADNKGNLAQEPLSAVQRDGAQRVGLMPLTSQGGGHGKPTKVAPHVKNDSQAGQQREQVESRKERHANSQAKPGPYNREWRPMTAPLVRHSRPRPWMSRQCPAYVP